MRYQVDTHAHTLASTHAYSTIHDYIAEAKRKGIIIFAITDHGPEMADAPHAWHFINQRVIPRIVDGVASKPISKMNLVILIVMKRCWAN